MDRICSTKVRKYRELELAKWLTGKPKREMPPIGHALTGCVVFTRYEGHGTQYHPNVTPNGHTERGNHLWLSFDEQATNHKLQMRRMAQKAKALGNAGDMLT